MFSGKCEEYDKKQDIKKLHSEVHMITGLLMLHK